MDGTKPGRPPYLIDDDKEMELFIKSSQLGYGKTRLQVRAVAIDPT